MDTTTFLLIIIILLGVILVAIGVYLILVLIEARKSLKRLNKALAHVESITRIIDEKVVKPAGSIVSVTTIVKDLVDVLKEFKEGGRRSSRE